MFSHTIRRRRGAISQSKPCRHRKCRVESLEARSLLSAVSLVDDLSALKTVDRKFRSFVVPFGDASPLGSPAPTGYTPAQVRAAYGFDDVMFGNNAADGAGQTIAIVDAWHDPNIVGDLQVFNTQFGLPQFNQGGPTFKVLNQAGGLKVTAPLDPQGWAMEVALDTEWAHAIAPQANIILVEANSPSFADMYAAVKTAAKQKGVSVVSMSFGAFEYDAAEQAKYDAIFASFVKKGVTFVASSGDSGGIVSYPSSSPHVLSVGGTNLVIDANNTIASETVWSYSGGGPSAFSKEPAWQQPLQDSGVRLTPDVAYNGDPATGFPVYDTWSGQVGGWYQVGGTSAGAPQWAALIAIVNQGRQLDGNPKTGPLKTAIADVYQQAAALNDIVEGFNGYPALQGYDLGTGLGSPKADQIIPALVNFQEGAASRKTAPVAASVAKPLAPASPGTGMTVAPADGIRPAAAPANIQYIDYAGEMFTPAAGFDSMTPGSLAAVNASWRVPNLDAPTNLWQLYGATSSLLGIDTFSGTSGRMIATGILSEFAIPSSGQQLNTAWWMPVSGLMMPASVKVKANDAVNASITYVGTFFGADLYRFTIKNGKQTFTGVGGYYGTPVAGVDATTGYAGMLGQINYGMWDWWYSPAVPDFGAVNFTGVTAGVVGATSLQTKGIGELTTQAADMVDPNYNLMAETSAIGADDRSFSVTWMSQGVWQGVYSEASAATPRDVLAAAWSSVTPKKRRDLVDESLAALQTPFWN